jgi:hypothetical protein
MDEAILRGLTRSYSRREKPEEVRVQQGIVFGSLLFLEYVNDIFGNIESTVRTSQITT